MSPYPPKKALIPRSRSGLIKNRIVRDTPIVMVSPDRNKTSPSANMAESKKNSHPRNKKTHPMNKRPLPILVLSLRLNMLAIDEAVDSAIKRFHTHVLICGCRLVCESKESICLRHDWERQQRARSVTIQDQRAGIQRFDFCIAGILARGRDVDSW